MSIIISVLVAVVVWCIIKVINNYEDRPKIIWASTPLRKENWFYKKWIEKES